MVKAGGISIHVFDVSRGIAAAGLRVELVGPDGKRLAEGTINATGVLDHPTVRGEGLTATGVYEAIFHIGDWYRAQGVTVPKPAFLETAPYRFGIADLAQHYHLPLKMTPWGFHFSVAGPDARHGDCVASGGKQAGGFMIGRRIVLGLVATFALAGTASAQQWPSRPVKLIVTFPPGGASDVAARIVAGPLSEKLGQTVIVDNKPGGGTTIGANFVLAAKDDFHTLMLSNSAPLSIAPYLFDKPPYDPVRDFTHVSYIGSVANAFVVRPAVPAKTMAELVAWIKGQGKSVPFGSGGQGSIGHIIGEMFKAELGLGMEHIGYRGAAPMFQDMMANQLDFAVVTLTEVLPLAKDGKLRIVALTSTQKPPSAPDAPLVSDLGYPKLVAENFVGISAPAGFPAAASFVTKPMTAAEFNAFVANQVQPSPPRSRLRAPSSTDGGWKSDGRGGKLLSMSEPQFDPQLLSVDDRLSLIDRLWLSIAVDAKNGDTSASAAIAMNRRLPPEVLVELKRRIDEVKRDPSRGVRWEDLNADLERKYG